MVTISGTEMPRNKASRNQKKQQKEKLLLFRVEKYNSEAFPLIWTRATRWEPPEGLKYPKIMLPKIKKKKKQLLFKVKRIKLRNFPSNFDTLIPKFDTKTTEIP